MDDFRKYATKHLGMSKQFVLDDVIKSQAGYLNPYIPRGTPLQCNAVGRFPRLMMDRIIFLGTQVDDYTANTLQAQLLYLIRWIPGQGYFHLSIRRAVRYMPVWVFMIQQFIKSDAATICTRNGGAWQPYCWLPVPKANAPH